MRSRNSEVGRVEPAAEPSGQHRHAIAPDVDPDG